MAILIHTGDFVYYRVLGYDLDHLEYRGPEFHISQVEPRCYVVFNHGLEGRQEINVQRATVEEVRLAIAAEVRSMKNGTVLVVEPGFAPQQRTSRYGAASSWVAATVYMLPFDDGENFNKERRRTERWCPSSADLDWEPMDRPSRFQRIGDDEPV